MRIFLFLTFLSCIAWAKPEISFQSEVEVSRRSIVTLGDIAQVENPTNEVLSALDNVVLPAQDSLSASEITQLLRDENVRASFKVPSQITIKRSLSAVSKNEIERKAINHLKLRCSDCIYKVSIQNIPYPIGSDWNLDLSDLNAKGSFLIPVRDGDSKNTKWISGSVKVSKMVPIATRLIQQSDRIQEGDLKLSMTDVTFAKDASAGIAELHGQQLIRSIQVGQPVWASDIKKEPALKRGQIVRAMLGDEKFEITMSMEALDNGFVGDTVKVKTSDSQKVLSATVVEKGLVKIQ